MLRAFIILLICLAVSAGLVAISLPSSQTLFGLPTLLVCTVFSFTIQWCIFIPSYALQTERFYDLSGSLTFVGVTIIALVSAFPISTYEWLLAAMVIIWAIRLGTFLSMRIKKDGKDDRFASIKTDKYRFAVAWTVQGLWVLLTSGAALVAISAIKQDSQLTRNDNIIISLGIVIWAIGFCTETIADWQKRQFKRKHPNQFITTGLWKYSQHPNYFGEILLWFGVALAAFPALHSWQYFSLASPVFVYLLLTKVSGIPMLDAKAKKKWGKDLKYHQYTNSTPTLVPFIGSKKT